MVLLPLYPHYSSTTVGSSLNEWNRHFRGGMPVHLVQSFYRDERYLDACIEKIDKALGRFPSSSGSEIVFSAHSLPQSIIDKGDPYQKEIEETVQLLMDRGGGRTITASATRVRLEQASGCNHRCTAPCATCCRESSRRLHRPRVVCFRSRRDAGEIDHEAREEAAELGLGQFEMTTGLNDSPKFIEALAHLVMQAAMRESFALPTRENVAAPLMAAD